MRFLIFLLTILSVAKGRENDTLLARIGLLENDTEKVNQLYQRGFAIRNADPQAAYNYAKLAEQAALKSNSPRHLAKSYNLLGVLYYKKGNYKTAVQYHNTSWQLRQSCNDLNGMAISQVNLGNVYAGIGLPEKAEQAYLYAIDAYRRSGGSNEKIADCLLNIGTLKHQQKHYDQAIENYKLAEQLTGLNDYNAKAIFLTNMAEASAAKSDLEKAIAWNEDALKLRQLADNNLETADNYLNLGSAYLACNELLKAKQNIDTAYAIALKYNYFELLYEAAKVYALYYSQAKNFEAAFEWQEKYTTAKDSIFLQQAAIGQVFDFNELGSWQAKLVESGHIHNLWLLVSVCSLLILIPLFLIRFRR